MEDHVIQMARRGLHEALMGGFFNRQPTQRLAAEIADYLLREDRYTPWTIINVQERLRELSARLEKVRA